MVLLMVLFSMDAWYYLHSYRNTIKTTMITVVFGAFSVTGC